MTNEEMELKIDRLEGQVDVLRYALKELIHHNKRLHDSWTREQLSGIEGRVDEACR